MNSGCRSDSNNVYIVIATMLLCCHDKRNGLIHNVCIDIIASHIHLFIGMEWQWYNYYVALN